MVRIALISHLPKALTQSYIKDSGEINLEMGILVHKYCGCRYPSVRVFLSGRVYVLHSEFQGLCFSSRRAPSM